MDKLIRRVWYFDTNHYSLMVNGRRMHTSGVSDEQARLILMALEGTKERVPEKDGLPQEYI